MHALVASCENVSEQFFPEGWFSRYNLQSTYSSEACDKHRDDGQQGSLEYLQECADTRLVLQKMPNHTN